MPTRLPDLLSLDQLTASYPRLAGRTAEACDEGVPALLYVRSRGQ